MKAIENLDDKVLKSFWVNEFNKLSPQLRSESISSILKQGGTIFVVSNYSKYRWQAAFNN